MAEKLEIIVEEGENEWWGRITTIENFLPVSVADTIPELIENIKGLILDWQEHEGRGDPVWSKVDFDEVVFDVVEELQID